MDALLLGAALAAFITGFLAWIVSSALGMEIRASEPEYATLLFRQYADQIIFRQLPVRGRVLFREEPPKAVASSVQVLRWIYGLYYGAFFATGVLALVSFSGLAA